MKGIKFILVLCLFASLYCSKATMSCALDKLPDSYCDTFVDYYKTDNKKAVEFFLKKKAELYKAINSCF